AGYHICRPAVQSPETLAKLPIKPGKVLLFLQPFSIWRISHDKAVFLGMTQILYSSALEVDQMSHSGSLRTFSCKPDHITINIISLYIRINTLLYAVIRLIYRIIPVSFLCQIRPVFSCKRA